MGSGGRRPKDGIARHLEDAAKKAELLGRLADLRIGSGELFVQTTEHTRMAICICDPHEEDLPIVYCNQAFVDLTGYEREEIVGRNCRFLQGADTARSAASRLRYAIENRVYTVVDILNYRKDGSEFWNAVHVGPIFDEDGKLAYFFGSQWDITELVAARETIALNDRIASELRHRTDNLFGVLTAIVRLSARGAEDVEELSSKIVKRIEALAGAHRASLSEDAIENDDTSLAALVEEVMRPYRNASPDRIELVGGPVRLPRRVVTPIGLTLHELATNALKYGSLSRNDGRVHVDWQENEDGIQIRWVERNAGGEDDSSEGSFEGGTGSRLIRGVIGGVGGSFDCSFGPDGFLATLRVPTASNGGGG